MLCIISKASILIGPLATLRCDTSTNNICASWAIIWLNIDKNIVFSDEIWFSINSAYGRSVSTSSEIRHYSGPRKTFFQLDLNLFGFIWINSLFSWILWEKLVQSKKKHGFKHLNLSTTMQINLPSFCTATAWWNRHKRFSSKFERNLSCIII